MRLDFVKFCFGKESLLKIRTIFLCNIQYCVTCLGWDLDNEGTLILKSLEKEIFYSKIHETCHFDSMVVVCCCFIVWPSYSQWNCK